MQLWSLSRERKEALLKLRDEKAAELRALRKKTAPDLWIHDLDSFLVELEVCNSIFEQSCSSFNKAHISLSWSHSSNLLTEHSDTCLRASDLPYCCLFATVALYDGM